MRESLNADVDLSQWPTAGLTDVEIAIGLIVHLGQDPTTDRIDTFLRTYEKHLPASLPRRQGQVLPGVRSILERLQNRKDVVSILLTGNTRAGARAKLTHYGLNPFFEGGAFSDGTPDRPTIARRAWEMVLRLDPNHALERTYVIGDTPHDIGCGRSIGARTIAVASGSYSEDQLKQHNPWWVIRELPEVNQFLEYLGVPLAEPL